MGYLDTFIYLLVFVTVMMLHVKELALFLLLSVFYAILARTRKHVIQTSILIAVMAFASTWVWTKYFGVWKYGAKNITHVPLWKLPLWGIGVFLILDVYTTVSG